jgi:hypothetical protein
MSTRRERSFECVFAHDRNEYRFHVRAWNAQEAEEQLRASLHDNGVRDAGTLSILDRRGAELRRSDYAFDSR